jgi:phosphoserine phosphatase
MNSQGVIVDRPLELRKKLRASRGSPLQVITDWDGTATTHESDTSWHLIWSIPALADEFRERCIAYQQKYYPFQQDQSLPKMERIGWIEKWWQDQLSLFREFGVTPSYFDKARSQNLSLREGIGEAFTYCREQGIPIHILSAGITQTIEIILRDFSLGHLAPFIRANQLLFDELGKYTGITPPRYIHIENKGDHIPASCQDRRLTTVLLWDNLHDVDMAPARESTIAIGFCSDRESRNLHAYKKAYDIVVRSNSSDLGVTRKILRILSSQKISSDS